MLFLFLSFFFFLFLRSKQKFNAADISRISTKAKYDFIIDHSDCAEFLSLPTSSNSRSSQLIVCFGRWDAACRGRSFFLSLFFLPVPSLSHSLIYTHTYIYYTFALSNSPSFLSSIQMKPQGDVIARANTYVERELFTVRMQEEKTGSFHRDVP